MDNKQQIQQILDLSKDPEMALLRAINGVSTAVENSTQSVEKSIKDVVASIQIPEQKETDLTGLNQKLDELKAQISEPLEVILQII